MLLTPFEWFYRGVWFLWDQAYQKGFFQTHLLRPKVVSVGNLTWGGSGKTPTVEYLARGVKKRGNKIAVLSRGYGAIKERQQADEVQWLTRRLNGIPIFADPDRIASAQKAEKQGCQFLILDDGFQHRRLARQLDLVTIDAADPFGNGHLIPAGKLREPMTALKRADWVILTKTDLVNNEELSHIKEKVQKIIPDTPISETFYRPVGLVPVILSEAPHPEYSGCGAKSKNLNLDPSTHSPSTSSGSFAQDDKTKNLDLLRGKSVGLAAAIGNPDAFKKTVEKLGAKVTQTYFKRDHSHYSSADFQKMEEIQKKNSLFCWVATSKDAIKMRRRIGQTPTVYELEIELVFKEGERELWQAIESL